MHRKSIVILILLCCVTFGNSLRNGFVGDDNFLILQNDFYSSFANMKDLFTSRYMTDSTQALGPADTARYFSGSVAYRPVLSLTYFWDYALWKENPFGYHLSSLLWHIVNVLLVYALFVAIAGTTPLVLLAAVIFAIHPFKSEAICAISYRADVVTTCFFLLAMLGHVYFRKTKTMAYFVLAHAALFLAIFAKEAAIVFPAIACCYDRFIHKDQQQRSFLDSWVKPYVGYAFVCGLYLWVYVYVFPNEQATAVNWLGGSLASHLGTSFHILAKYFTGFVMPFFVKVLPPVFVPSMPSPPVLMGLLFGLIVMLSLGLSVLCGRQKGLYAFHLSWMWLAIIPVSNVIPLVNPMAHRFMYLPSIGISFMLAVLIFKMGERFNEMFRSSRFVPILAIAFVIASMIVTIRINSAWRHDYIMAHQLYQKHPRDPMSHLFMGLTYVRLGELKEAEQVILKGMQLGLEDPRVFYALALSRQEDYDVAIAYLMKGVEFYPDYPMFYLGLGRTYLLKGQVDQAEQALRKSLELQASYRAYNYLLQALLIKGDESLVQSLQAEIAQRMRDPEYDAFLIRTLAIKDTLTLPEDNGF